LALRNTPKQPVWGHNYKVACIQTGALAGCPK
jgi:hypothetical protein